jgi:hypothetical protein
MTKTVPVVPMVSEVPVVGFEFSETNGMAGTLETTGTS